MRIQVKSRIGKFDFCHPEQESISTHIAVYEGENRIMYCNITTEDEIYSNDPEDIIYEIDKYIKRTFYSSSMDEVKKIKKFIEENIDLLLLGNKQYDLEVAKKQRDILEDKIEKLQEQIIHLQVFPQIERIQEGLKDALH